MANSNNTSVSLMISGLAGWNRLTAPQKNKFGSEQYTLFIEKPVIADDRGTTDVSQMDPTTAQVVQMIEQNLIQQPTQQRPNASLAVNLSATSMSGQVQKPRYFDRKTNREVPVEHDIATGQPIQVVVGARLSDSSKYGVSVYMNGVIFDDVSQARWYSQNSLLSGFKPLDGAAQSVTPQDFAAANNTGTNPFGGQAASAAPAQPEAPAQPAAPAQPDANNNPFAGAESAAPATPEAPQAPAQGAAPANNNPFAGNEQAPQAGNPFATNGQNPAGAGSANNNPFGNATPNANNNPFAGQ